MVYLHASSLFLTDSCIVDWTAMHAFECLRNRSIGLLAFGMIFSSVGTAAAEVQATSHSSPAASPEAVPGLQWVDWLLIAVYARVDDRIGILLRAQGSGRPGNISSEPAV